ncbi:MAG: hypothetical protein WC655_10995 [Candidatus Hydrogenedentales bacterium]|jgi:hypothetical protein
MNDNPPTDPFRRGSDFAANACIGYQRSFGELSQHYRRSADALVEAAMRDSGTLDVHVFSICFLFRQCIELELKEDLWMTEYARTGRKIYIDEVNGAHKRHELRPIWDRFRESAMQLLDSDFPLTDADTRYIDDFLDAWTRHDKQSYAFRYPISLKKGERPLAGLTNVNLVDLQAGVHHTLELLGQVMYFVSYLVDERLEYRGDD